MADTMGDQPPGTGEQETATTSVAKESWSVQSGNIFNLHSIIVYGVPLPSADHHFWIALIENGLNPSAIKATTSPIQFFHILERLKTTKRQGWVDYGVKDGESIADHMYRMSIITMLCPQSLVKGLNIDVPRCTKMALIHDMAESLVGDLTPSQKHRIEGQFGKGEKSRREAAVMRYFGEVMLGNVEGGDTGNKAGDAGNDIMGVWQEYEDSKTTNSKFVHDVDKIELMLQMVEYERKGRGSLDLHEFTEVADRIQLQEVKDWWEELKAERKELWNVS